MIEGDVQPQRGCFAHALAACAVLLAGCSPGTSPQRSVELAECRLPRLAIAAQCTTIEVPEDHAKPEGRKLAIFVAVLKANTLSPQPDPLLIVAGGPGQAASALAPFAARLVEVRRTRDIVLVDQRGAGRSAPLDCAAFKPDDRAQEALDVDPLPKARACVEELRGRGIDLAQYTTGAWIADLEAVRGALGVDRWNLWGGSYGSRVALEYVRRHPQRVRTAILDGVAPPSIKISLDVWRTRERAIDDLFAACRASSGCARAHADLAASLARIQRDLGPMGRDLTITNPRTGVLDTLHLTFDGVLAGIHPLTYLPELASAVPAILERAAAGDWAPLLAAAQFVTGDIATQMSVALHYSVTCAEDVPRVTSDERARLASLQAAPLARMAMSVCEVWPRGRVPDDAFDPVVADLPVLLLSGGLDPVTPPAYAEEVGKTLPRSRHVVAAGYGHIVSPHACGPRLLAAFVDRAGFDTLPLPCLDHLANSKRPPLWADRLAPAP